MVIKTNKLRADGIEASSVYYIHKAIVSLGHTALCVDDEGKPDLVLNIDGKPLIERTPGVPCFLWDCDSFDHDIYGFNHPLPDRKYDQIFVGGAPEDVEKYPPGTVFLPHAFDPDIHKPLNTEPDYDIVFAGSLSPMYQKRKEVVQMLKGYFKVLEVQTAFGEEYNAVLNRGKLIFSMSLGFSNVPMRFFEGMAIGALLHNDTGNLDNLATRYLHYIPYTSTEELIENARQYLEDENRRKQLVVSARGHALRNHTYIHRVKTILSYL